MNVTCQYQTVHIVDMRPPRNLILCESSAFDEWEVSNMTAVTATSTDPFFVRNNSEALIIFKDANNLTFIPLKIDSFFPNLKLLRIFNTKISKISSEELRQFPKLQTLILNFNLITELPANLLEWNQELLELVIVGLPFYTRDNSLHTIGENMLVTARKLEHVNIYNNFCVYQFALNRTQVIDLNSKLHIYCGGGVYSSTLITTQTTTLSTASSTTSSSSSTKSYGSTSSTTSDGSTVLNSTNLKLIIPILLILNYIFNLYPFRICD